MQGYTWDYTWEDIYVGEKINGVYYPDAITLSISLVKDPSGRLIPHIVPKRTIGVPEPETCDATGDAKSK